MAGDLFKSVVEFIFYGLIPLAGLWLWITAIVAILLAMLEKRYHLVFNLIYGPV